jgi:hypothetical protein
VSVTVLFIIFVIVFFTGLVIKLLLENVTDALSNLNDLSHVHARSSVACVREVEPFLSVEFNSNKILQSYEVCWVIPIFEDSHYLNCLLVCDGAELVCFEHVKHRFGKMLSKREVQNCFSLVNRVFFSISSFNSCFSSWAWGREKFVHGSNATSDEFH